MIKMFCACLFMSLWSPISKAPRNLVPAQGGIYASSDGVFIMELDLSRNDGCARCLWSWYVMVTQGKSWSRWFFQGYSIFAQAQVIMFNFQQTKTQGGLGTTNPQKSWLFMIIPDDPFTKIQTPHRKDLHIAAWDSEPSTSIIHHPWPFHVISSLITIWLSIVHN